MYRGVVAMASARPLVSQATGLNPREGIDVASASSSSSLSCVVQINVFYNERRSSVLVTTSGVRDKGYCTLHYVVKQKKDLLIEVYFRNLLALVNSKMNIKLSDLYDKLGSYLRPLETLGVTTSNYAAMLYPVVESCLPIEILKAWDRYRLNREVKENSILTKEKVLENLVFLTS
ncbi:transposable element Tc1 transposase [Caerostris extrusa]|uniref:Transposable element Tc1 transposase n=1 Tax=Caerostris extrusa TaxID=172846 RepID=A0AAV4P7R0_CAEEX|nr:transposable element Tc1 transposase [Caerostris extrusa]